MAEVLDLMTIEEANQLFIHFNVEQHFVKLDTFVETATNAQKVVEAYNQDFFSGQLEHQLIVLAPEQGTFLSKLALYVWGGTASVFAFLETDIGKAYFKGLTGNEPAEYAETLGEEHGTIYEEARQKLSSDDEQLTKEEEQKIGSTLVIEMAEKLLQADRDTINRIVPSGHLEDALDARGEFYEACLADTELNGIGFDREDEFPIPRSTFAERAVRIRRDEESEEVSLPWQVSVENIFVTSPNWDKDDQKYRNWKGKDAIRKDCYFIIEDEEFWQHAKDRDLRVDVLDSLKVQWAFQSAGGRPKNRRVLRVLEFNGESLATPLEDAALRSIVGDFSEFEETSDQPSLFEPPETETN